MASRLPERVLAYRVQEGLGTEYLVKFAGSSSVYARWISDESIANRAIVTEYRQRTHLDEPVPQAPSLAPASDANGVNVEVNVNHPASPSESSSSDGDAKTVILTKFVSGIQPSTVLIRRTLKAKTILHPIPRRLLLRSMMVMNRGSMHLVHHPRQRKCHTFS
jgi:hypothetical protein